MNLAYLNNRHAGETILLCGSGPGIDLVNWSAAPRVRVGINHAGGLLPRGGHNYMVALDRESIIEMGGIPRGVIPVLPAPTLDPGAGEGGNPGMMALVEALRPDLVNEHWLYYHYFKSGNSDHIVDDRDEAVRLNELYHCYGTATPAAHLCWLMGAAKVIMAGMDGTAGYAPSIAARYGKTGTARAEGHRLSTQSAERVLRVLGIPHEHYKPGGAA